MGARLKFWRRSRVPKKGSRDEAVEIPDGLALNTGTVKFNIRVSGNGILFDT